MVAQVWSLSTKWNLLQFPTMPVCVGSGVVTPLPGVVGVSLLMVVEDEVVVEDVVVEDVPVVIVVLENLVVVDVASSVTLPSTQYSLLVSRLG